MSSPSTLPADRDSSNDGVSKFPPIEVHDLRCRGRPEDCLQICFKSDFSFENGSVLVLLTHHTLFKCFEMVVYSSTSTSTSPWTRCYLSEDASCRRISRRDFEAAMDHEKSMTRQRHRHCSFSHLIQHAKYSALKNVVQHCLNGILNMEITRRFLEEQRNTSETILDPIGRPVEYRSYLAHDVSVLIPRPPCLVATNLVASKADRVMAEHQKMMKLKPLFGIAARRLLFSWSKCLPLAPSSTAKPEGVSPIHLPRLFPSHSMSAPSLFHGQANTATIAHLDQIPEETSNRYIGTRVSMFLRKAAIPDESHPLISPRDSEKLESCYDMMLQAHSEGAEPIVTDVIRPEAIELCKSVSAARVRWIVAIDRTIRNSVYQRIVERLQQLPSTSMRSTGTASTSSCKTTSTASSSGSSSSSGPSKMGKLRTRVMAVAALSRLHMNAQEKQSSPLSSSPPSQGLKSPVTVASINTATSPVTFAHVPTGYKAPSTPASSYRSTDISKRSPASTSSSIASSPMSLPPIHTFSPGSPATSSSSCSTPQNTAAMQQLRGAWMLKRQASSTMSTA